MNTSNIKYQKIKKVYFSCMIFILINFYAVYIISCKEQQDRAPNTIKNMTIHSNKDAQLSITDAYIMPDPIDEILLNTIPQTVKDRNDTKKIVQKMRTIINPEMELYKYLQRKREYAKTSIFNDIP